jgi:ribosomal-protein-alanine N-acetyltransferase
MFDFSKCGKVMIETERLVIKTFCFDDFSNFLKIHSNEEVMRFFMSGVKSLSEAISVFSFIRNHQKKHGFSYWGVFKKDSGEYIGQAGVTYNDAGDLNLCFAFLPEFWGKGYARESVPAVIDWVFKNVDVEYIVAIAMPENKRSREFMEKIGMKYTVDSALSNGVIASHYIIYKKDWQKDSVKKSKK